jgi:hypothetical protein
MARRLSYGSSSHGSSSHGSLALDSCLDGCTNEQNNELWELAVSFSCDADAHASHDNGVSSSQEVCIVSRLRWPS